MLLGVIADDFTGAGDIAGTLAKGIGAQGGLATAQYMGVPDQSAGPEIEAGVVSLKTRSVAVQDAVGQSLRALRWLEAQGCRQIVFKYCSTFDSTPAGNIGQVAEALAEALGVKGVVACPAFPATGRTLHQGHLFVGDRLLHESGMQHHPLTPMTDSNLRRWLSHQTRDPVGLVPTGVVRNGPAAVRAALEDAAARGETLVIVDSATEADLLVLAQACADARLLTGGSGIALGLPANFIGAGVATGRSVTFSGIDGPEAILAGSCSGTTREQIEVHAVRHPSLPISVDRVMDGHMTAAHILAFLRRHRGEAPLAYSSGTPAEVEAAQTRYGRAAVAERLDALFGETARLVVEDGVRRLVVAGGETSGAVAQALNPGDLLIGPEIDPGVSIVVSNKLKLALAFKSGNFGRAAFFEHALSVMKGPGT